MKTAVIKKTKKKTNGMTLWGEGFLGWLKRDVDLVAMVGLLAVTVVAAGILHANTDMAQAAKASSDELTISVPITCTMSSDEEDVNISGTPGGGASGFGNTMAISCNDTNGWAIYAVGYGDNTEGETDLVNLSDSSLVIPTGTSGDAYWSMSMAMGDGGSIDMVDAAFKDDDGAVEHVVPSTQAKVISVSNGAATDPDGVEFAANYTVQAGASTTVGTYTGAVKYTLVDPATECPGDMVMKDGVCTDVEYMQDITTAKVAAMTVGEQVVMADKRDNKLYYVAKLADGNVWMTQNLDFDIPASGLTSADSDVTSSWDSSSTYAPTATSSTVSSSSDNTGTLSWNLGDYAYDGTTNSDCGGSAASYADCSSYGFSATSSPTVSANHYHVGNLYQWNAATAGTGGTITSAEATDSICPRGWRLPTSTSSGELQALVTAYSAGSSVQTLLNSPLYFVRGGYVYSGTLRGAGSLGDYWSSTADSSTSGAYYLNFSDSSNVGPSYDDNRYGGRSVRCVAHKTATQPTITYNNNGGTGTISSQTAASASEFAQNITLSDGTGISRSGYTLAGWSTNSSATTAEYTLGQTISTASNLTLYAVWEEVTVTYMQDITSSYISSMTTGEQVVMVDKRDNKKYYVAKLADGNVWMTQNLDLDLNASTLPLTSATSDVSSSWDPGSTYYTKTAASSSSTNTDMYSWSLGDYAYDGTTNSSCGTSATSYADCTSYGFSATSSPTVSANHYHVGNLYQWNAATAGTGGTITSAEATDSICPKGWRLPTSTSSGELQALVTAYSAGSSVQTLLNSPLYFVRGGYVSSGTLRLAGDRGAYWSSTADSSTSGAYSLSFYDSSRVSPSYDYYYRYSAQSVRCVVGS